MTDPTFRSDMTVRLVKHSAADVDVADAARVSTQGDDILEAFERDPQRDKGLINFLMRDRHGSPFEHATMTFFVSAPIFVAREFFRHRAGWSYNEESGRYSELKPIFYVPSDGRPLRQVGKPGAYEFTLGTYKQWMAVSGDLKRISTEAYSTYKRLLDLDVAREVARMVLPVNIYTSFYATCNSRSLMHFLGLRTKRENARVPSFPQLEIQMVADQMEAHFASLMPETAAAFDKNGRVSP
ncbi:FAD-dependent thymidylate synthase [Streptomyces sp. NPDC029080]|uniref:FAD-dependent thymidylate synthase n=1 Tax=Streptomyces sp. NPDC029080 TaxID=3155017 RepID=UPI0033E21E18